MPAKHSAEARKVLRELDSELADSSARLGQTLSWSASERLVIEQIMDGIDRKSDLLAVYLAAGDDPKLRIKLSVEMRLLEQAIARLLRQVSTEPTPEKSTKAVKAAQARWNRRGA